MLLDNQPKGGHFKNNFLAMRGTNELDINENRNLFLTLRDFQ